MKLIVGLGNPGDKYKNNRHNAGFMMIDYIVDQVKSENLPAGKAGLKVKSYNSKLKSELTTIEISGQKYLFIEPQTYMNKSGDAIKAILSYYKLQPTNLKVLYDDLDIRLGDFKIQVGTGPQLHNGVLSLEQALGTRNFTHVRIGVDNPSTRFTRSGQVRMDGETYVLQDFTSEEKEKLVRDVFPQIRKRLLDGAKLK